MYHEISKKIEEKSSSHEMTPFYNISADAFESQMQLLHQMGYKSLFFDEVSMANQKSDKYVIITFDDGLIGNYEHAYPILNKYGFKAVFFVSVGSIGKQRYMSLVELEDMVAHGMSVQSHTVSHVPLQDLKDERVYWELDESKRYVESKLNIYVTALSFPHGSFNSSVIKIAKKIGYKFFCTSEVMRTYKSNFLKTPAILGRITMTSNMDVNKFVRNVEYHSCEVLKQKMIKSSKNTVKRIVGIEGYRRMYRKYLKINSPDINTQ